MRIKAIDSVAKKVGGIENLIIYFLLALIIILIAVFLRLNFLVNLFQEMCFYEYPSDYICSCIRNTGNSLNFGNFSISP